MECLVCNNRESFARYLAGSRHRPSYWKCDDCGFVFASPLVERNYQEQVISDLYESEVVARMANYELRYEVMRPFVRAANPKVLDIGCYTGLFLKYLKKEGITGTGIEPNRAAAQYGRDKLGVDIREIGFDEFHVEEKYDVITLFNVLEHLGDPKATLIKIREIISASGILTIEIPNIFHLFAKLSLGYWHHYQHGHHWFFSFSTLTKFLNRYGFNVDYKTYVPKVVVLSKLMDVALSAVRIYHYVSGEQYRRIRNLPLYRALSSVVIRVDKNDYILFVCSLKSVH